MRGVPRAREAIWRAPSRSTSTPRIPAERTTTYKIRRTFDLAEEKIPAAAQLQMLKTESHAPYTEGAY